jgi:hypothetical protein
MTIEFMSFFQAAGGGVFGTPRITGACVRTAPGIRMPRTTISGDPKTKGECYERRIGFDLRFEWPRSHCEYRAQVFLTARVQRRWGPGKGLR